MRDVQVPEGSELDHSEEVGRVVHPSECQCDCRSAAKQTGARLSTCATKEGGAHLVRVLLPTSESEPQLQAYP
jgi:hypothetical protein